MEKRRRMRRKFSAEFKAETVRLVQSGGRSIADVVRDLDLTRSAVERWVKEAEIEAGRTSDTPTVPAGWMLEVVPLEGYITIQLPLRTTNIRADNQASF